MIESWTLRLINEWNKHMSIPSILKLRSYLLRKDRGETSPDPDRVIGLRLRGPMAGPFWFRERGSDFGTYNEVAIEEVYGPVVALVDSCSYLVDLGANIGVAARYFAGRYPGCRVFAVEAMPENFGLLRRNLSAPALRGRVTAVLAAVWSRRTTLSLVNPLGPDKYDCFEVRDSHPHAVVARRRSPVV